MYLVEISTPQTAYVFDTHIPRGTREHIVGIFSAYDAKKVVRLLNRERYGAEIPPYKKPARYRIIARDVAVRYMRIYGGSSEWVQTDVDSGFPVLIDADGDRRGMIDPFDKFPAPEANALSSETLADIPF